jgi:F-type H+-transporting ATPase subunit b
MQINWFTVIAQVINFLILVWLLKRFLYRPILSAIDEREKKIAALLADAEAKKEVAQKEQDEFRKKNEEFDLQKEQLMGKAVAESNEAREKLLEGARNEAIALRAKAEKARGDIQADLNREIAKKMGLEVFVMVRKALSVLGSTSLEEQTVKVFVRRLHALKDEEKQQFVEAFTSGSNTGLVQSAFELSAAQQAEINSSVNEILGKNTLFQFKTIPALISGIELIANGYKLGWNIQEYVDSLETSVAGEMTGELAEGPVKNQYGVK